MRSRTRDTVRIAAWAGGGLAVLAAIMLLLGPIYRVWSRGMDGKAALNQAEHEKRIMIEQARAEVEAAKLRAEAIKIVGQAAKDFPEYRLQEFMGAFGEAMQSDAVQKIVFVPTEANIPITEAGRTVK